MVIGIIGGMGSIATVDFFSRLVRAFPAEKEWDRPRIIIDNRCDMPSRVRGILYGEKVEEIEISLTASIRMMIDQGCSHIVLACNTSHHYLDAIYEKNPDFEKYIVNIIDLLAVRLACEGVKRCCLVASEGTYLSGIYDIPFQKLGISYSRCTEEQVRMWIEAVKGDQISEGVLCDFSDTINEIEEKAVILGCTELPVLYGLCGNRVSKNVYDPLECAIRFLKRENERSRDQGKTESLIVEAEGK